MALLRSTASFRANRTRKTRTKSTKKSKDKGSSEEAKQVKTAAPGPRHETPQPPMPQQHLCKPGLEADRELKPRFEAPHYRGSGKLQRFSTLITGGDSGIGRTVALLFAREGAHVAIVYLNEHEDAEATRAHVERGAAIVNTGSVTGMNGSKHLLDYSTNKGAIHAFTKALAANLAPKGIRVNAVAPGPVWTPLNPADQSPEDIAEFGKKTDMGRPAQPEELSPACLFLAAPCCSS